MSCRERPLIALQEDHVIHFRRRAEIFAQEFAFGSVFIHGDKTGQDLHVAAGNVPAELERCQPELRFRQVPRLGARFQCQPDRSGMHFRINARLIQPAGSADCEYHIFRGDCFEFAGNAVDKNRSDAAAAVGQQLHCDFLR